MQALGCRVVEAQTRGWPRSGEHYVCEHQVAVGMLIVMTLRKRKKRKSTGFAVCCGKQGKKSQ